MAQAAFLAAGADPEVIKDLRRLGKPPSFDGTDSEFQDVRFALRIHLSLINDEMLGLMNALERPDANREITLILLEASDMAENR